MAANQLVVIALVLFAAVGMASAAVGAPPVPGFAPGELAEGPVSDVIGTITGGAASDAAPIGGPVAEGAFPNLSPAFSPTNGVAALKATTVAGAVAAGVVGSIFFF